MPNYKDKEFKSNAAAEAQFSRALKKIARHSGHIVEAHVDGHKIQYPHEMLKALQDYSKLIEPWARSQAAKMLAKVNRKNKTAYQIAANKKLSLKNSREMSRELNKLSSNADVWQETEKMQEEQVALIKSIPLDAGTRAMNLSLKASLEGARASEVAEELKRSTNVSESKAILIARTEVARANAHLTQARASSAGAHWYIWRTTMDGAERDSHREMNGEHVRYDTPPHLIDGTIGHAGTFPNCRCWQDPQFDDDDFESE